VSEHGVLFVDHAGVLGGAELSLLDLAVAFGTESETLLLADGPFRVLLERRGVKVSVESLRALKTVKKETRIPGPAALTDALRISRHVARHAKPHRLIYANSQKSFVVGAAAGLLARRPVAWHLRDILAPPHFSGTNVRAAVTLANLRAARVIANSHATAAAFTGAGGHESLVRVVHNGIDPAPFDAVTPAIAAGSTRGMDSRCCSKRSPRCRACTCCLSGRRCSEKMHSRPRCRRRPPRPVLRIARTSSGFAPTCRN
jgi:Glycosyl transferase 4-like domain